MYIDLGEIKRIRKERVIWSGTKKNQMQNLLISD